MNKDCLLSKLKGGLYGAAIGDSMGAITEHHSIPILRKIYPSLVDTFLEPYELLKSRGHIKGMVTDDFSVGYYSLLAQLNKGERHISSQTALEGLMHWNSIPQYARSAGPTTKVAIQKAKGEYVCVDTASGPVCDNSRVTNGGGMKAGIMGLLNPGDIDSAIDDAITLCAITHDNTIALSSACAIAAATAGAFRNRASYVSVLQDGIYGAEEGLRRAGKIALPVAGGNIAKKISLAVKIGLECQDDDMDLAISRIADIVGCGLYAYESIPAVFGFIAASRGEYMKSIVMAINAGDDTDTVACMLGYITGSLCSVHGIPVAYQELINTVNGFDLDQTAQEIENLLLTGGRS